MEVKNCYEEEQRGVTENNGLKLRKIRSGLNAMVKLHSLNSECRRERISSSEIPIT